MKIKETIKLIEKLLPLKENLNQGEINNFNLCISKLEKSADEFAIEFAEWCNELRMYGTGYYENSTKQLLEIFKKEKKL